MSEDIKKRAEEILEKNGIEFSTGTGIIFKDGWKPKISPYISVPIVSLGKLNLKAIATVNAVGAVLGIPVKGFKKSNLRLDIGATANYEDLVDGHLIVKPFAGISIKL